jgi:hypothetical protein
MKKQRKNSKTRPDERPNQIEVSFAEPERPRRIPLIINATFVRRSSAFILAQVAWVCRITGKWTNEYSARKGGVC